MGLELLLPENFDRDKSYGEMGWEFLQQNLSWESLRQNSGTIVGMGAGMAVGALTCWSGPGAGVAAFAAGSFAAGLVGGSAGTATDWALGNGVSLNSFGGHCFEGLGGLVPGRIIGSRLISTIPHLGVRWATIGVATSGATSAIQYIPDLVQKGPSAYLPKVGLNAGLGLALWPALRYIPRLRPLFESPVLSHTVKAPLTQGLFETGSEVGRRTAYILNLP
jgi:hypothetical protein